MKKGKKFEEGMEQGRQEGHAEGCEPIEADEELLWLTYEEAIGRFYHPHHRWAVELICG